ncbi:BQ2448_6333 [Microbotryum intermedium]|uniref:BQ2448_6333 protein n=1 Tax=Microbotryum intermedium TaxID=269621 RepID=A0A238FPG8_9BASI|nr:BQ2448_6333 [Microbotryum intermedium]
MSSNSFNPPVASPPTASPTSLNWAPASTSSLVTSSSSSSTVAHYSAPPTSTSTPSPDHQVIAHLRAFSPPKWIFSHPTPVNSSTCHVGDDPIRTTTSSFYDPQRVGSRHAHHGPVPKDKDEEAFPAYAPKRSGIRFVKASSEWTGSNLNRGHEIEGKTSQGSVGSALVDERVQISKGSQVRGLYESLVGLEGTPRSDELVPKESKISPPPEVQVDIDLTSDRSDSDSDPQIIILDPTTRLPEPLLGPTPMRHTQRARARPNPPHSRAIHELLPPSQPSELPANAQGQPLVPLIAPTHYAIPPTNIGWRILERQGWKEGASLGVPSEEEGSATSQRLKVPLKASDKFDRKGLGIKGKEKGDREGSRDRSKKEKERENQRREWVELEKRGKGRREIEMRQRQEAKERKELLAYMNRA